MPGELPILLGCVPLAVLAIGVFVAWRRPLRLRWVNLAAFTTAGLILIGISLAAGQGGVAFFALVAWGVAVPLSLWRMLRKTG